ncbi:MAG: flippase [Nanoarchaeota archaeon]|nr:flippase [Nanoarchaeota archaeon]
MGTVKRVAKNSLWNFFGTNAMKILTMVIAVLLARFLGDISFGKLSFALAFTEIFSILIDWGTRLLLVRDISTDKNKSEKYLGNVLTLKIFTSIIVAIIIFILVNLLGYPADTKIAVYLATLITIFQSFQLTIGAIYQAFERQEFVAITKIIRVILRFAITLPLLLLGYGLIPVMIGYVIVFLISLIITSFICRFKFINLKFSFDKVVFKHFFIKSIPFMLSSLFVVIFFKVDIVMLEMIKGEAVVGWYSAAHNLVDGLVSIPMAISAALLPVTISYFLKSKEKLIFLYKSSIKFLSLISFPVAFGTLFIAKDVILTIYGIKYQNSILALQYLVWSIIPIFIVYMMGNLQIAIHREKIGMYALGFTALTNIVLNLILIPKYSLIGAAIATLISQLIYIVLYHLINNKYFEKISLISLIYKQVIASIIMAIVLYYLNLFWIMSIIVGAAIYSFLIIIFKTISKEELSIFKQLFNRS